MLIAPRAGVAQLVERQLPKLNVEGSSPFSRSNTIRVGWGSYAGWGEWGGLAREGLSSFSTR